MNKRIIGIIIFIIIESAVLNAQHEINYEVKKTYDNTIQIIGYNGKERNITIPDVFDGLKVTSIAESAFRNKGLISIIIPDSVDHKEIMHFVEIK